jgi:hypothetical protein
MRFLHHLTMAPAIALLWLTQGQTADQTVKIPLQTALQIVGILCVFPWVAQLATTPTPRWIHLAAAVRRAARQADRLRDRRPTVRVRWIRSRAGRSRPGRPDLLRQVPRQFHLPRPSTSTGRSGRCGTGSLGASAN